MKKLIIAAALTVSFATMANAHSGLSDRINEDRSFPNKTVEKANTKTTAKTTSLFNRPEH